MARKEKLGNCADVANALKSWVGMRLMYVTGPIVWRPVVQFAALHWCQIAKTRDHQPQRDYDRGNEKVELGSTSRAGGNL